MTALVSRLCGRRPQAARPAAGRHHVAAFGELRAHEPAIRAVARDQLRMAAAVGHRAVCQHQDAVGVDHAGQAVRQDQRGAAGHQPVERLLDHRLVLGIHRGQRLVQHQDRRVAQQGAGDGDALALATGEPCAAFADHGLVAVGQRLDEVVRVGGVGGGNQVRLAGVGAAETQVVLDRAVEQVGVLRHDGDHPADRGRVERAQVLPANADRAALRVMQAQQQADDRGLAGAAGADDADALACGDAEGQALVGGASAAGIGEADIFEGDAGAGRIRGQAAIRSGPTPRLRGDGGGGRRAR